MSSLTTQLLNLGYDAKYYLGSKPLLYWLFYFHRDLSASWVSRKTSICIEGFPRSGNTFAVGLFRLSTGIDGGLDWPGLKRGRAICSHTHVAMLVVRAARLGVPCIAVIREPISTLTSWIIARKGMRPESAVRQYLRYYRCLQRVENDIVLADFPTVTNDFKRVVDRVNEKYGTRFDCLEITSEVRSLVFERLKERHDYLGQPDLLLTVPSSDREGLKEPLRRQLEACARIGEAKTLYQELRRRAV
jgi:hypothetical protein